MFYAILGVVVVVALFLIFRDDHDKSYNRNEKKAQRQSDGAKRQRSYTKKETSQPKTETQSGPKDEPKTVKKTSGPSLKEQILGEIEAAIQEAKKGMEEPMSMVRDAMDQAKTAIDSAMKGTQPDVDEQYPEDEEMDLSFLDTLDYYEDLEENTETFDITGLRYYCTVHDCGKIVGYVKPDPSNVHDARAQAVIRSDGKLLGYIPRTQLDWYEDFNEQNVVCPFVGEIELDRGTARLIAEIKVIIPTSQEYVEEEIEDEL